MYRHILLAVALQRWEEFTPYALTARDAAVAQARQSGAKLSVLSVYNYGKIEGHGLPAEMLARYREIAMRRIDSMMEGKMKAFLAGVPRMDIPITPLLIAGEPRKMIVATARNLEVDLLFIGAHSKRGMFGVALGGTASYVSRRAPCPVVMLKPGEKRSTLAAA